LITIHTFNRDVRKFEQIKDKEEEGFGRLTGIK